MTSDGRLMTVGVSERGDALETAAPKMLFATRLEAATPGAPLYTVSADGTRFLILSPAQEFRPAPITVVMNWPALLKK
jgi:hypothetical protein